MRLVIWWLDTSCASIAYLFLLCKIRAHSLDAIAALDNVGLEGARPRSAMQFEKETAGIAEDGAVLVASP